jgi:hypothetical protein
MMHLKKESPAGKRGNPVTVLSEANNPENNLDTLRAQYLAEIFALPASTAVTVAELAFGEAQR